METGAGGSEQMMSVDRCYLGCALRLGKGRGEGFRFSGGPSIVRAAGVFTSLVIRSLNMVSR